MRLHTARHHQSLTSLGPRPSMAATGQRTMSNSTNESKVRTRISGEIVERQFSSADCATPDLFNSSGADAHVIVTVSVIAPMQFFFTCSKEKTKHCRGGGEGRFRKLLQNSFAALRFKFRSNRGKQRITSAPTNRVLRGATASKASSDLALYQRPPCAACGTYL